jgi:hypothetical protein
LACRHNKKAQESQAEHLGRQRRHPDQAHETQERGNHREGEEKVGEL